MGSSTHKEAFIASSTAGLPSTLQSYTPYGLAALRIVTAYLFIQHGTAKLFGFPHQAMFDNLQLFSLMGIAGVMEVVGGALLAAGLFTRSTAFVLSGMMAVAYFMAHAIQGNVLAPMLNGGELAALYSVVFLLFVFSGPGALSIDSRKDKVSSGHSKALEARSYAEVPVR